MAENQAGQSVDTSAAEAFEKYLVPTVFGPWSQALVDLADPKPGSRLLDVGCGTGAAARYAAEMLGEKGAVAAIDLNAGMIAHARNLDAGGAVEWHEGDIMALPFEDGAFRTIVGNQVLQFLPDRPGALAEMRRVMSTDGRAVFGIYCQLELCPAHCAVANALDKHDVDPSGIQHPYSFGDPVAVGDLIETAGFRDVSVVRRTMEARFASPEVFVQALAAGGPSARHALEQLDETGLQQVIEEVSTALADYVDADGLRVLTASNVVVAQR
ncbi:MAG: methyltransferase domain-containing protein [Rhodospirillaceae bacterium]|jgi:ubiquinone/menaquinone biosynthesis C-methylase UbiE|nr:methyltransferase domain-containing protein [Rhodospirillaceae bacterium]MBT5457711.1 methyltransferase domain-containing protein [Rhodospirillaceae bacterium]